MVAVVCNRKLFTLFGNRGCGLMYRLITYVGKINHSSVSRYVMYPVSTRCSSHSYSQILYHACILLSNLSDKIKGLDHLWIMGDNFVARTYRKYFKERPKVIEEEVPDNLFCIKQHFEFNNFSNSRSSSATKNILIRLQIRLLLPSIETSPCQNIC